MRRTTIAISVVALLSIPCLSFANPDGLVGSITLEPSFRLMPQATQFGVVSTAGGSPTKIPNQTMRTWRAGMTVLMPISNAVTVGLGVARFQDFRELTDIEDGLGLNHVVTFNEVTFLARIHLRPGGSDK